MQKIKSIVYKLGLLFLLFAIDILVISYFLNNETQTIYSTTNLLISALLLFVVNIVIAGVLALRKKGKYTNIWIINAFFASGFMLYAAWWEMNSDFEEFNDQYTFVHNSTTYVLSTNQADSSFSLKNLMQNKTKPFLTGSYTSIKDTLYFYGSKGVYFLLISEHELVDFPSPKDSIRNITKNY